MTETATPEATTAPESTEPTKAIVPVDQLGFLPGAVVKNAEERMAELKAIADKQAKVGDVGKLLSEAIAESDNADVKKLLGVIEKAHAAINRATAEAEALVKPTLDIPSDEQLKEMDTQYKTLSSELNALNIVFSNEVHKTYPELDLFDYVGQLPGKRKGAKAGQGTGMARPRVTSIEYTQDQNKANYVKAEKDGKSTFSILSQLVKEATGETVSASDFHDEWNKQNGVKDWSENNEVSEFTYSVTDAKGKTHSYWVRVTK
jgi:hypothetical protein